LPGLPRLPPRPATGLLHSRARSRDGNRRRIRRGKAFKALSGVVKAAKAGEVRAALRVVQVAEQAGVPSAAKRKIVAEAVAGLTDEAIEDVGKTMARSGGMTMDEHFAKLRAGLGEHSKFKQELEAAAQLLENVQGRIPEHAR
jgi:hypothetical protein